MAQPLISRNKGCNGYDEQFQDCEVVNPKKLNKCKQMILLVLIEINSYLNNLNLLWLMNFVLYLQINKIN